MSNSTKGDKQKADLVWAKIDKESIRLIEAPKYMYLLITLVSILVALFSSASGITEAWAWEIARTLITLDGVLLGFIFIGVTLFLKEGLPEDLLEAAMLDAKKALESAAKIEGFNLQEYLEKEFTPTVLTGLARIFLSVSSLKLSVMYLLTSTVLAICLYGASETLLASSLAMVAFWTAYYAGIFFLILGTYKLFNGVFILAERIGKSRFDAAVERVREPFEEKE